MTAFRMLAAEACCEALSRLWHVYGKSDISRCMQHQIEDEIAMQCNAEGSSEALSHTGNILPVSWLLEKVTFSRLLRLPRPGSGPWSPLLPKFRVWTWCN